MHRGKPTRQGGIASSRPGMGIWTCATGAYAYYLVLNNGEGGLDDTNICRFMRVFVMNNPAVLFRHHLDQNSYNTLLSQIKASENSCCATPTLHVTLLVMA